MKDRLYQRTGAALIWKAVQLGGVKGIFALRLLILAWLLSPEDFGLLAIAASTIGFLLAVTDFGMVPALVQGVDVDEKRHNVAWTVAVTRALIISGLVAVAAPFIAQIFAEPRAIPVIRVLAMRPLLEAAASIKVATLTRNLQFRPLAILKLVEAIVNTILSIALAPALGVWALVAGALAGAGSYLVLSYLLVPHRPWLSFDRAAARSLIRFGRWIFLTSLVAVAASYVLRMIISRQLGTTELGLYYLAAQLAFLPAEAASEVVGAVAFPLFARLQLDIRRVTQAFQIMVTGMSTLLFPVSALIIALAPSLITSLMSPQWAGAVPIMQILALVSMIGVFGEATVPVLYGLGQPYKVTMLESVQSFLIIIVAWGLTRRFDLVGAALAWLPAIVGSQLLSAMFMQRLLTRPLARLKSPLLAITAISGIGAAVAVGVTSVIPGLFGLVTASLLAMLVICALLWISDRRFELGLFENLGRAFPQLATLVGYTSVES